MPARRSGSASVRHVALLALLVAAATVSPGNGARGAARPACAEPRVTAAYTARVERALRAGRDIWGEALLAAPGGPTYERARRYLAPLFYARARRRTPLTASGVYYLPFGQPPGVAAAAVALHVADGSQILSRRADGRSLTVAVGPRGRERYGSCLVRLRRARLAAGYLPIVETGYVDAAGARYAQESFVARIPETRALVSFVRLTVDARRAAAATEVRFAPSVSRLAQAGNRLVRSGATYAAFGPAGAFDGAAIVFRVPRGGTGTAYVAWLTPAAASRPFALDEAAYAAARQSVVDYWQRRLSEGASIDVPERRVADAARSLLIQNLVLTWRYSIGNPYEQFSFPEGIDAAQVMGEWGYAAVERAILRTSLTRRPTPYPNWKMGQKLLGSATYYGRSRDAAYIRAVTPVLRRYVAALGRQITASRRALLRRERYSSDIPDSVYGLHSQAVAWQGLRAMAHVWAETGERRLALQCRRLAARLEHGLRAAVRVSQKRLPDGSLFIPVRLLDGEQPYGALTASRPGSYWNLVAPYALASGLFPPGGAQATGALRYLLRHGSRLLGVVRAAAFALYRDPVFPTSGTDHVYNTSVARFLAANDEADQLVLGLYGGLAAAMTPDTFVSGEAASVAPLERRLFRAMYLPPNGASNAAWLATLRLILVHETPDAHGVPRGLELAHATPRAWLRPGRRIAVANIPTSFGPVSFTLEARAGSLRASVAVPERSRPRVLRLRLRLPGGNRISAVTLNGRRFGRFDRRTGTIDLSRLTGTLELDVGYARSSS